MKPLLVSGVHVPASEASHSTAPVCAQILPPPTSLLSLDHSSLSLPQHSSTAEFERGGMVDDMNHINALRGAERGGWREGAVILYISLYEALSPPRTADIQTSCGGFGNPSSDPNVSSQSRTKTHRHHLLQNPRGRVPFLPVCSSRN